MTRRISVQRAIALAKAENVAIEVRPDGSYRIEPMPDRQAEPLNPLERWRAERAAERPAREAADFKIEWLAVRVTCSRCGWSDEIRMLPGDTRRKVRKNCRFYGGGAPLCQRPQNDPDSFVCEDFVAAYNAVLAGKTVAPAT